jgi:prepilin-type N-terminal cleavage/methylation domain-containing protein
MIEMATPTWTTGTAARALSKARRGFSLIELVIVVVIIGIIAAIAVPRMSRGSQGASDSALGANLAVLRNAIDLYQTEHQAYPATGPTYTTTTDLQRQLTKYTDASGASNGTETKDAAHPFGPYLRKIPALPVGSKKGLTTIKIAATDTEAPGTTTEAWIYYPTTGEIKANLPNIELDGKDQAYNTY